MHGGFQFHAQWMYLMWGGLRGPSFTMHLLFDGVMVLISPLLDDSCVKMLTLDNNLENEKSFHGPLVGNSKRSCWFSSSFDTKGSPFDVPPLSELKKTLNIEF
jgi:hypothetical protein